MLVAYYPFEGSRGDDPGTGLAASSTDAEGPRLELSLSEPEVPSPRPGSLEETLLQTTRQNRDSMLARTIRERGFECQQLATSDPIGRDGRTWRTNCGNGLIYTIQVDEFGRMSVDAAPYGDVDPSMRTPEVEIIEENGQRRLQLRMR